MDTDELAVTLLDRAAKKEQVAHRVQPGDDLPVIRQTIRRLARERALGIRTAVIDGVLVVVRADARIWTDDTATMRAKLTPEEET